MPACLGSVERPARDWDESLNESVADLSRSLITETTAATAAPFNAAISPWNWSSMAQEVLCRGRVTIEGTSAAAGDALAAASNPVCCEDPDAGCGRQYFGAYARVSTSAVLFAAMRPIK
jgi:hypothetical protein